MSLTDEQREAIEAIALAEMSKGVLYGWSINDGHPPSVTFLMQVGADTNHIPYAVEGVIIWVKHVREPEPLRELQGSTA